MQQVSTAVVKQKGDSWIGWIEELPGEALEFNRQEARSAANKGYEELQIAV